MNFIQLGIKEQIADALTAQGITEPTDIQQKVIPEILKGSDLIGISKTGSGKTIAFSAPILSTLHFGKGIQFLIVVPIRELAEQISKEIMKFAKELHPRIATIYGGVSMGPQTSNLRVADIVVGTPGRLLDHLQRGSLDLRRVKVAVLDEADKMATMGFIEDVERILQATPTERQTLLFGATITDEIAKLRDRYMRKPVTIRSAVHVEEHLLNQYYYDVDMKEKFSLLVHLLRKEKPKLAMIFCASRRNTENVSRNLKLQHLDAHHIHGGLSQSARLHIIDGFHKGRPEILVATAVAARGLDIKGVTHVFTYDVPKDSEEYVHQIGRTARAGGSGKAITLLASHDYPLFSAIINRYPVKIQKLPPEPFARIPFDSGKRRFDRNEGRRPFTHNRGEHRSRDRGDTGEYGRSHEHNRDGQRPYHGERRRYNS